MRKHKTIDLFAGIGGIRLAFEKAGFKTVFANDYEKKCAKTYNANFSDTNLTIDDIKNLKSDHIPKFDFLLGGFPCQPFSIAGERKGFNEDRGTLFFEIVRILKENKPTGFFLENVKNLRSKKFEKAFEIIIDKLEGLGYDVKHTISNTSEHGNIPQNRERIYFVGFLKKTKLIEKFEFPKAIKLTKKIEDMLEKNVKDDYYYNNKPLFSKLKKFEFKKNNIYQWRRKYLRENKSNLCPTLTANMGTGGHNVPIIKDTKGIRKLTPRECANFQGFPSWYKLPNIADSILYKQIGNSVSIPVVSRIAKNMMSVISD